MIQLTWDDLLIQNITADDAIAWMAEWPEVVAGRFHPVFISKFGDWFLRRPDGATELLDVLEGTHSTIASTTTEFDAMVNDVQWQEEHLLSWLVHQLHEDGKIPADGQCYGFAPHPRLGGPIDRANVMILEIIVWQTICSQAFNPTYPLT
ncbi:MAG: DUF1851 domain-containing protein [Pirellulaceae bacterium]|jgi:hypothetical protein|nr:DUF1851 domain-containing protein [Pirellulaceae bacterium]MDP7020457.1 DUF1851 domain-containing protein [Pirellulaceae bacterium]